MTDPQNLADRLAAMQNHWDEASTERPAPLTAATRRWWRASTRSSRSRASCS
jgi:hypothetical protein